MIVHVDPESPVPPYEQIRQQLEAMIGSSVLPEGTRLPTIRQLSRDLGLASGTVARAYRELESSGSITTQGRKGTFVSPPGRSQKADRTPLLQEAARALAVRAVQLGADEERVVAAVREAFSAVEDRSNAATR